jgi:predicted O-methyltransferase YrrM
MPEDLPAVVQRAQRLAVRLGFPLTRAEAGPGQASACLPGVGRFLAVLAAGCAGGVIAELGTGSGVGTAWLASAMPPDCRLITVEIDEQRARAARELFADDRRVEVIGGDAATEIAARGPFDLLFADCGIRDDAAFASLVDLLRIGGYIVMDDVTPLAAPLLRDPQLANDAKRRFFASERLVSTEVVLTDLANSLLAGARVG